MFSLRNVRRSLGNLILTTQIRHDIEVVQEQTPSQLLLLPPEIILVIGRMLPAQSSACFSLCCRYLYHILGSESWKSIRSETPDVQIAFLSCLVEYDSDYFVCLDCIRLHRTNIVKWPRLAASPTGGPRCIWFASLRFLFLSNYRISFPHIQLAIKQQSCGTDIGFPLDAFQHLEVEYDRSYKKTTLLSVDAQIVSNEFLMRSQTWVLLPWSHRDDFIEELAHEYWSFNICIHTRGRLKDSPVMDLVKSGLDILEDHGRRHAQILTCPCCWMDYVLDARDFGERGFAVLVTRWMNLGAGLDSADAKWKSLIIGRNPVDVRDIRRDPGDIRTGFEDQAGLSVEALTADNERKLFSRRQFRRISRGRDGCVWKWDRGWRWYLAPSGPAEKSFWQCLADE